MTELQPDNASACNALAHLLTSCPDVSVRNTDEAIALAQRAVSLTGGREPVPLDTLAAAYAGAGRYPEAIETTQKAMGAAAEQKNTAMVDAFRKRLSQYETDMARGGSPGGKKP